MPPSTRIEPHASCDIHTTYCVLMSMWRLESWCQWHKQSVRNNWRNSLLLLHQSCMTLVPISISQTEFSFSFGANYTNSIIKCLDNTAPMFNTLNMVLLPRDWVSQSWWDCSTQQISSWQPLINVFSLFRLFVHRKKQLNNNKEQTNNQLRLLKCFADLTKSEYSPLWTCSCFLREIFKELYW